MADLKGTVFEEVTIIFFHIIAIIAIFIVFRKDKVVLAEESVLDEWGRVDPTKLNAFVFDQFQNGYYAIGEKIGQAWKSGAELMK